MPQQQHPGPPPGAQPHPNPQMQSNLPPGAAAHPGMRPRMMRPPNLPPGAAGIPAQGILPNNPSYPGQQGMRPGGQPGAPWQPRHPQEITLQQRGPMGGIPPVMGMGQPGPQPHPVMMRQESTPPPPPAINMTPPPQPPDNPQTEEDRQKVVTYEKWINDQNVAIKRQLDYYETEIGKLRKTKKVKKNKETFF